MEHSRSLGIARRCRRGDVQWTLYPKSEDLCACGDPLGEEGVTDPTVLWAASLQTSDPSAQQGLAVLGAFYALRQHNLEQAETFGRAIQWRITITN